MRVPSGHVTDGNKVGTLCLVCLDFTLYRRIWISHIYFKSLWILLSKILGYLNFLP